MKRVSSVWPIDLWSLLWASSFKH